MVWVNPKDTQAKSLSGYSKLKGIYRHRTSKRRFKITLESGKHVIVTEDHSVMVEREGKLIEVKPLEINRDTDVCISIEV
jgi:intein/homing endonuclease